MTNHLNSQHFLQSDPDPQSKVLICGLGSIGRKYLRLLRFHWPSLKIAVLRSGRGQKCPEIKFADDQLASLEEALEWSPATAIISSPAPYHLPQALPLAKREVPLLIEKPISDLGDNSRDLSELLRMASQVPLLVGYVLRYDSCAQFLFKHLAKNSIGNLIEADFHCASWLPDWRPDLDYRKSVSANKDLGGGVLMELSHEIDLANWLIGPVQINSAQLTRSGLLSLDVEDNANILGSTPEGALITFRLNFCTKPSKRTATIRGSDGEIGCDFISRTAYLRKVEGLVLEEKFEADLDIKYLNQLRHFFSCIAGKEEPKCSIQEGIHTLNQVKQAYQLASQFELTYQ